VWGASDGVGSGGGEDDQARSQAASSTRKSSQGDFWIAATSGRLLLPEIQKRSSHIADFFFPLLFYFAL
ncbi:hypothetical protein PMAYCL1PPCAC_16307, partial [Pristionchus mayeri]